MNIEQSFWRLIRADTHRQFGRSGWWLTLTAAISRPTFRVVVTMRMCQAVKRSNRLVRVSLPLFRILHRIATRSAGMDFSWQTSVGGGLALTHGWGLVISPMARIGRNVTLLHGVTLGRRDRIARDGVRTVESPVLEDEVWIGPHAIVIGGVTVGRGSRIAGGAFVTQDVPAFSIVSGNPAVIVKRNCVPDVMNAATFYSGST
jgi:serine O-acetyltransferase